MTPYGIVYNENPYAFEKSMALFQKKFGVLRPAVMVKISMMFWLAAIIVIFVLYFTKQDALYALVFAAITLFANIITIIVFRKNYTKNFSRVNFRGSEAQAVLFENRIEFTTPTSKGEYYYDEFIFVHEKDGIITFVIDPGATPVSICSHDVKKGDFKSFSSILKEKLGDRYKYEGGVV